MEKEQFDYYFDCKSFATTDCEGDCDNCNFHPDYLEEVKHKHANVDDQS